MLTGVLLIHMPLEEILITLSVYLGLQMVELVESVVELIVLVFTIALTITVLIKEEAAAVVDADNVVLVGVQDCQEPLGVPVEQDRMDSLGVREHKGVLEEQDLIVPQFNQQLDVLLLVVLELKVKQDNRKQEMLVKQQQPHNQLLFS